MPESESDLLTPGNDGDAQYSLYDKEKKRQRIANFEFIDNQEGQQRIKEAIEEGKLAIEQSPGTGESKNLGSETLRGLEEILLRCADAAGKSKLAGVAEFLLFASLVVSGYVELTAGLTLTGLGLAGHPSGMEYGTIKDGLILLALSGISYASYKKMDVG